VNGRLVVVIGDVINDIIVRPRQPTAFGTDTASDIERSPGGSGANQAAWLGALHARVRFVGRAGASDAAYHRECLRRLGVEALITPDLLQDTGTIVVMVSPEGERSMFTDRGANAALSASDLPASLLDHISLLHLSGYQLFEAQSRPTLLALWSAAADKVIASSVDPASLAGLRQVGARQFLEWTEGAEFAFPNLDEGRFLTGHDDPEVIATALLDVYGVVALKLGPAGAIVASPEEGILRFEAAASRVVDSTGAGDAFCAGFLAAWLAGSDLRTCGLSAVQTAARSVSQVGARPRNA
jgi:sugar/nucleoside kinase (ribokinase family)